MYGCNHCFRVQRSYKSHRRTIPIFRYSVLSRPYRAVLPPFAPESNRYERNRNPRSNSCGAKPAQWNLSVIICRSIATVPADKKVSRGYFLRERGGAKQINPPKSWPTSGSSELGHDSGWRKLFFIASTFTAQKRKNLIYHWYIRFFASHCLLSQRPLERKTMPHSHFEVTVYQSYYKRTLPLYHALVMREKRQIACRCIGFSIQCKYTNRF